MQMQSIWLLPFGNLIVKNGRKGKLLVARSYNHTGEAQSVGMHGPH